jgi:hypothetical protein
MSDVVAVQVEANDRRRAADTAIGRVTVTRHPADSKVQRVVPSVWRLSTGGSAFGGSARGA